MHNGINLKLFDVGLFYYTINNISFQGAELPRGSALYLVIVTGIKTTAFAVSSTPIALHWCGIALLLCRHIAQLSMNVIQ